MNTYFDLADGWGFDSLKTSCNSDDSYVAPVEFK